MILRLTSPLRLMLLFMTLFLASCAGSSATMPEPQPHTGEGGRSTTAADQGKVQEEQSSPISSEIPEKEQASSNSNQSNSQTSSRHRRDQGKSLAPAPSKLPSEELETWNRNSENITPEQVQEKIPTEELADWLSAAYQDGIDPEQVQTALRLGNWHSDDESFQVRDIDGDGQAEWLITLYMFDPGQYPWGSPGDFWVMGDEGLEYRFFTPDRYFDDNYEIFPDFFASAPQAIATRDMTGDEQSEIVLERKMCGAHTCSHTYYILSNHFGTLTNTVRLNPATDANHGDRATVGTIYMTYAEVQPLQDETGDGLPDFSIHGGWVGSAGSGIQRTRTEVWAWDGDAIALTETRLDPTDYRFHILWEANDQFDAGNADWAFGLYSQVMTDGSLDDEGFFHSEEIKADTQLFAGFRLTLLSLMEESEDDAQQWHNWMVQNYPDAKLTAAATILMEGSQEASLEMVCDAITEYLKQFEVQEGEWVTESPTRSLRDMGYANPSLTAEDVCPL